MRTKGSAAELEQRRRIAARLLEQGMKPIRVAEALGVSPAAVTRWKGPRHHGYPTELWTLQRVAEVIAVHFGVQYHRGHVWKILRAMAWSCQKPERRARERDEQAIRRWRQEDWPRIKKRPT